MDPRLRGGDDEGGFDWLGWPASHDNSSVILAQELNARHRTPDTRGLTLDTCQQSSPLEWLDEGRRAFLKRRDFHKDRLSRR